MSTYPPKLDKARKAWLASLKEGDDVASVAAYGPPRISRIGRMVHSFYECGDWDGSRTYSLNSGRSPAPNFGAQDGGQRFIVPATSELRREERLSAWRKRIFRFGEWATISDEQIEAIAKILGWTP